MSLSDEMKRLEPLKGELAGALRMMFTRAHKEGRTLAQLVELADNFRRIELRKATDERDRALIEANLGNERIVLLSLTPGHLMAFDLWTFARKGGTG